MLGIMFIMIRALLINFLLIIEFFNVRITDIQVIISIMTRSNYVLQFVINSKIVLNRSFTIISLFPPDLNALNFLK